MTFVHVATLLSYMQRVEGYLVALKYSIIPVHKDIKGQLRQKVVTSHKRNER